MRICDFRINAQWKFLLERACILFEKDLRISKFGFWSELLCSDEQMEKSSSCKTLNILAPLPRAARDPLLSINIGSNFNTL